MNIKTDSLIPASTVATATRPAVASINPGTASAAAPAGASTEPAAKVRLSETARVPGGSGNESSGESIDLELVREIQERLEQGTLKIDFDAVARSLLQDAIAMTSKPKSGVTL